MSIPVDDNLRKVQEGRARHTGQTPPPPRKWRIVSDGMANRTRIFDDTGRELTNVTKVIIYPIEANKDRVRVSLELIDVELNITAQDSESPQGG